MQLRRCNWILLGLAMACAAPAQAGLIFNTNATFRYFKGRDEASRPDTTAWRQVNFDDTTWPATNGPFYYGEPISGTLLDDMQGGYTTLYLRRTFVVTDPSATGGLRLDAITDDGHIIWINGAELGRFNVGGGERPYTGTASSAIEPTANTYTTNASALRVGTNVIAVQGFNASLSGSSDFVFSCSLSTVAPDVEPPTIASRLPAPGTIGSLSEITVVFSEPVVGVNASDLLVNGNPATGLTGGSDTYTFTFLPLPYGPVSVTWAAGHGITDFASPPYAFDGTAPGATWQYHLVDNTAPTAVNVIPFPEVTVRSLTQIQVEFSEAVTNVEAADLRVNGVAAASLTTISASTYLFQFPQPSVGSVQVAWADDHAIRDLAVVPNSFAGGSWSYTLDPNAPVTTVRINEFVAANVNGLRDEDNEREDWVELYNTSEATVSLAGWSLTDNENDPLKWIFPNVAVGPRSYLIVFCSGKDRRPTAPGSRLHTNFKLDPDGEYLALYNAEVPRQAVSVFDPFPNQRTDYSYGYDPVQQLRYFATPTPGAANGSSSISGVVSAPHFSHTRGFYTNTFSLVLTCATANATIRYTLNGTAPTASTGFVYANPITVTGTMVIRAAAYRSGYLSSEVDCHTYLFLEDVIQQSPTGAAPPGWPSSWGNNVVDYGMDPDIVNNAAYNGTLQDDLLSIPTFSIVMNLDDLFGSSGIYANPSGDGLPWERPCSIELIYPEGTPGFQINCGIRIRGGFSRSTQNPKHAFRLFFRQEYGQPKLDFPFFGPGGARDFDKFDMRTMQNYSWSFQNDSRMMCLRDQLARDQQLAMSGNAERGDFYHLYINGQYWGLFNSDERPEAAFGESYYGGRAEDYDTVKVDPDLGYSIEATDGTLDAWQRLWEAANNGFAADADYYRIQGLNPDGTANPAYENLLDVPNLVDYMLVILYGGNLDAPISNFLGNNSPNNWYGVRNRTGGFGGFRFFAHDSEHTLLSVSADRTGPYPAGDPAQGSSFSKSNPQYLWQRLQANAEFRMLVADRVQKHCFHGGALSVEGTRAFFLTRSNEIQRAVVAESARWGDAKRSTPYTRDTWVSAMNTVAGFINGRTAVLLNQLRADGLFPSLSAPVFNEHGGAVSSGFALYLTNASGSGVIYYTLDGTDPRLRGGSVSGTALAYAADTPIVITLPTTVRARVRSGTTWSPITEAIFYPPQHFADLQVTEIMYNPPDVGSIPGEEYEFLELKNTGTNLLDLSGTYFSDGIDFTNDPGARLGPGQFLVLGRNAARLTAKYPGLTVHGRYTKKLDNGGERITLRTPLGTRVLEVDYKDSGRWPIAADGHGFSLVPRATPANPNPNNPSHWRASTYPGGSPGADDPPYTIPGIVINEALTHTDPPQVDAIELYNPTPTAADIGGWYLTDDAAVPKKFRIPDDTLIAGGGYLVFTEDDFNATPGTTNSFALDSGGEEVYLLSADAAGNLTGYTHGFNFAAAPNGVSFGRHVISTGDEHFVLQEAESLDGTNAGPRVGPVVIRQIMYHPPDLLDGTDNQADEYLEIHNFTMDPVRLYDPLFPTNTWRVRGGVDFDFPTNVVLGPTQSLVLVSFHLTNTAAVSDFRGKYGGFTGVPLFGPYDGKLDNSSDTLRLQRPDLPDTNGVPYITVDEVDYRDSAPWPSSPDGSGAVLQRVTLAAYGDDPANWRGYAPLTIMRVAPERVEAQPETNVTFTVTAIGTGEVQYQWRKDGVDIPEATNDFLSLTNVQVADDGYYSVLVRDDTDAAESAPVVLLVLVRPVIVQAPLSQVVVTSSWVTLSCEITGNPAPFTYEWRKVSLPLWTDVSNDRVSFYTFQAPEAPTTFSIRVVVKNLAYMSPGVSHPQLATITVVGGDTDGDGLPDDWENAFGLDPNSDADATLDLDGDGASNRDEHVAGTDPRDSQSCLRMTWSVAEGPLTLSFQAISNKTYTVQYKNDLGAMAWSKLADVVGTSTNRVVVIHDPAPSSNRFYRLTTPQSP